MSQTANRKANFSSAYAIFEGGGAKGIAHIGALRAMTAARRGIIGVAGTSAGAIIAALVAVGYTADELFSGKDNHLLKDLGYENPISVLGLKEWQTIRALPRRANWALYGIILGGVFFVASIVTSILGLFLPINDDVPGLFALSGSIVWLITAAVFGTWVWRVASNGGVFEATTIRNLVNEALRRKLAKHYQSLGIQDAVPDTVLFKHIDPDFVEECIPLKIVVTNVTTGELTLFDRRNQDVPVAEVVAASAALPMAFRPADIPSYTAAQNCKFTDGGLVSNLPSWVFRDEKRQRERLETVKGGLGRIPIYAFALSNSGGLSDKEPSPPGVFRSVIQRIQRMLGITNIQASVSFYKDVAMAGIFGSQTVVQDFVPDLRVIPISSGLDTIDFDCSAEQAEEAVNSGENDAYEFLEAETVRNALTQTTLNYLYDEINQRIVNRRSKEKPRIRLALIDPIFSGSEHNVVGFKVTYGANMHPYADDQLDLDVRNSIAAAAFNGKENVFGEISGKSPGALRMTKYEYALLPKDLASVIALPIYAQSSVEGNPQRILAIDSTDSLFGEFKDARFMKEIRDLSVNVSRKLIESIVQEELARSPDDE